MFRTSAISFVIAMIFSSIIGTSFLDKGYHLRGGIGRWGEVNILFSMMEMSMLASTSPQNLCLPSRRANMVKFFRSAGVIVGVDLPAKPLSSVEARQHAQDFPGLPASLLASTSPQILCLPSRHANMLRLISIFRCPRMK